MPQEGQRSITIKESIYDKVKRMADQEHRTVANMAELILLQYMENQ